MTTTHAASIAAELNIPTDFVDAFLDSFAERMLRPAVERFGDVDRAATALAALMSDEVSA